jgi:excisionase family DNA binding protein
MEKQSEHSNPELEGSPNQTKTETTALPKLAYSPEEAAQVLGICRDTVYRLLKRGLIKSSSALRHKLIPHVEIERFLRSTLS